MTKLYHIPYTLALLVIGCQMACQNNEGASYNPSTAQQYTQQYVQTTMAQIAEKDTIGTFVNGKNAANVQTALKNLYNKKALLWQDAKSRDAKPAIEQYLKQLRTAAANGLNPADYGLANIEKQYAALYPPNSPEPYNRLEQLPAFDHLLSASALAYAYDMLRGRISGGGLWDVPPRNRDLINDLPKAIADGKITELFNQIEPNYSQYKLLRKQLATETNADLKKRIALNMDRYRLMPSSDSLGSRYVWVNIPEFMLQFVEGKDTTATMNIVVGEPKNATPVVVNKKMNSVIFSPVWNVPTNIAYEEIEYILKNPAVLIVADVDVWLDGKKVDPRDVDWENTARSRIKMRQRPKSTNSMGLVKFAFDNNYGVYLHDSPSKEVFSHTNRAQSHGCVRVGNPAGLAAQVLKGSKWTDGNIRSAMNSGKQQPTGIPKPVRVNFVYFTTYVDKGGNLQTRRDVYGHDSRQMKQL